MPFNAQGMDTQFSRGVPPRNDFLERPQVNWGSSQGGTPTYTGMTPKPPLLERSPVDWGSGQGGASAYTGMTPGLIERPQVNWGSGQGGGYQQYLSDTVPWMKPPMPSGGGFRSGGMLPDWGNDGSPYRGMNSGRVQMYGGNNAGQGGQLPDFLKQFRSRYGLNGF